MDNKKIENKKDWSKEILDFYNSEEYQKLNEYYNRSTIFDALGIQRSETIHSKFLEWLLDPASNHQLSDIPLRKFLRMLSTKNIDEQLKSLFLSNKPKITIDEIETERISYKLKKDSYGRIDLFISLKIGDDDVAIVIENKIDAGETTRDITEDAKAKSFYEKKFGKTDINSLKNVGQTVLYQFWAEVQSEKFSNPKTNKIYVYLTPNEKKCESKDYVSVTYQEIVDNVIEPLLSMSLPPQIKFFIEDYLRTLGKPTLNEKDEKTIIAISKKEVGYLKKLGKNFSSLISIVLENRKVDKTKPNEETRLKNFWKENKNLLLSILKETDPNKYEELKKEKPIITYEGNQFEHFSDFVWKVIKDYVDKNNVNSIEELDTIFETGNKKGNTAQMFATQDDYDSFQTEKTNNYWQKEPIRLNGGDNIYVTRTWKANPQKSEINHNQQKFIDIVKNVLNYKIEIE